MNSANFKKEFGITPSKLNKALKTATKKAKKAGKKGAALGGVAGMYAASTVAHQKVMKKAFNK